MIEQKLITEQRQRLSQQMQQSVELLQMNSIELGEYLTELSMENPLIEVTQPNAAIEHTLTAVRCGIKARKGEASLDDPNVLHPVNDYESITDSIREQIAALRVPELLRRELKWLCAELDEKGYLPQDPGTLQPFGGSRQRYENAVAVFQSLEPPGIGARSLGECLELQLRRLNVVAEVPYVICREHLDRLARGQLNYIADTLDVDITEVYRAKELISSLEPKPANGFLNRSPVPYIFPDIEIVLTKEGFEAFVADRYIPSCEINSFYADMAKRDSLTVEEREYFSAKLAQAQWAIDCLSRRREMLYKCAKALVRVQQSFFRDGVSPIKPFTMSELATELKVHPSTVSRAVKGKYLQCKWGVFPLSHFFAREVDAGNSRSTDEIMKDILQIIANEDRLHPMSDQMITNELARMGCTVSRRTVAKYREEAGIPSASGRKER